MFSIYLLNIKSTSNLICNPLDENRAITLYNKIISDCKIINPNFYHFNKLYSRPIKTSLICFFDKAKQDPIVTHYSIFTTNYEDEFSKQIDCLLDQILSDQ